MVLAFSPEDKEEFSYEVSTQIHLRDRSLADEWLAQHVPDSGTDGDRSLWVWISNGDIHSHLMTYRFKHEHDALQFALTFT